MLFNKHIYTHNQLSGDVTDKAKEMLCDGQRIVQYLQLDLLLVSAFSAFGLLAFAGAFFLKESRRVLKDVIVKICEVKSKSCQFSVLHNRCGRRGVHVTVRCTAGFRDEGVIINNSSALLFTALRPVIKLILTA